VCRDGSTIPYFFTGRRIVFDRINCIIGVGIDITERRRAEAEHKKLLHDLGERVKELTVLHKAARILHHHERKPVSELLAGLVSILPLGWQYPEITAARIRLGALELTTPGFARTKWMQRADFATADGRKGAIEIAYLAERPAEAEGPFLAEEASLIASLAEMVRLSLDRRLAVEALKRLNVELEQRVADRTAALDGKTRELETFAYTVAHDLKAPLRGIDGYSRLLLEHSLSELDEEGQNFLNTIRSSTAHMSQLIEDLLAYSRIERRHCALATVELRPFVEALVGERSVELLERNVAVTVNVDGASVLADANGLAQALSNYLDNAIKFSRTVDNAHIEIGASKGRDCCLMWVRDNGIGFDMRYHDRIFDIFQRLHRAEEYAGTGVGLAIVRKAMARMGGRAWAESEVGRGATFFLEVPAAPFASERKPA
jgi:signal transduction histidine kinase